MPSDERVNLGILSSDLPIILDALEGLLQEINEGCDRGTCSSCDPKRNAIARMRFAILAHAPEIKYSGE